MRNFPGKSLAASLLLLVASGAASWAQTTSSGSNPTSGRENNPYSKYGIGEMWNGNNTALKGMGSVSSAWVDPYLINSDNPATYTYFQLTTFEGGMSASTRTVTAEGDGGKSYTTGTASIAYLALGFPIGKKAGLSFGLKPYTRSYYALTDTNVTALGQTVRAYSGDGGLSNAYIGAAYRFKKISFGFNLSYLFGTYRNFISVSSIDSNTFYRSYNAQFNRYTQLGGLVWKAGIMYDTKVFDSGYSFRLGATYSLGQSLNQSLNYYEVATYNFGDTIANDTSVNAGERSGKLTLPSSFSVGVLFARDNRWSVGADFASSNWREYKSSPDSNMNYNIGNSTYRLSLGGEFTPNPDDMKSYSSRVTYRLGAYTGTDYVRLQNTTLPVYGLTFGASLPFRRVVRTHSRVHLSMDIGRYGTKTNGLLQQTYVRFGLGLSFNDKWFIPRKYD